MLVDGVCSHLVLRLDQTCKVEKNALSASSQRGSLFRNCMILYSVMQFRQTYAAYLPLQASEKDEIDNKTLRYNDEEMKDKILLDPPPVAPPSPSLARRGSASDPPHASPPQIHPLLSTLRQPVARYKRHGRVSIVPPISSIQIKTMILASANVEAQPCLGKLLLDQLHKRLGLADVYD